MEQLNEELEERLELALDRLADIKEEKIVFGNDEENINLKAYFDYVAEFILYVYDVYSIHYIDSSMPDLEKQKIINYKLYEDILPDNYENSFANPAYAVRRLGKEYGTILSFLYTEVRACIAYVFEEKMLSFVATVELFLEIYIKFLNEEAPLAKYIKEAIYYFMYDYADVFVAERTKASITADDEFAKTIIMNSDLSDISYLYKYGEYISDNEIKTAQFLNKLSQEEIDAMAATYVNGFIEGFKTMRIDIKPKKTVNIRYSIGQERMIRSAINQFEKNGLKPVIFRYAVGRINRKLTLRNGYVATPANKQYDYDHRMDEALFMDKGFLERKLEVIADTYEKHREEAQCYAGPAVIETFGENPFKPVIKDDVIKLSEKQQKLSVEFANKTAEITNKYIPRDKYSFTIIAYPTPEIGDDFEEIFAEIVKVNTLDNEKYKKIQQNIILALDESEYVHVKGKNGNKTDIKVMLHDIDISKETNFENCLADVNIPLGEVFTSPKLTGTNGILNVSKVYLNELKYINLYIEFEDGLIKRATCDNFDNDADNEAFIKENLLFNHETLPIGEFAIGTNTTAYAVAEKYDILYKLPILIVEKMGPHFAVGDTCYSYSEEAKLYNPDGREIVAKENECSIKRKSEDEKERTKAYFNCHTDITIPYEELEGIYAVREDGTKTAIIEDGRFVLEGTEELNKPLDKIE